jgi:hypothetical protein
MLPFWDKSPTINWLNNLYLIRLINQVTRDLGFSNIVMWYFYYNHASMVGRLGESLSVYTAHDVWEEYDRRPRDVTAHMEQSLLRVVDIAFFTSYINYLNKRVHNPNSHYISHGSPPPDTREYDRPSDLPAVGRIIGYWGLVDGSSIDTGLVHAVSKAYPEDNVVLIGLCPKTFEKKISLLLDENNVHYLGMKKRTEMAQYLRHFDVGIIPYPRTPFRIQCSPLKVFDYISFGLPVVSIDIHELKGMGDLVYLSDSQDDFVVKIGLALDEGKVLRDKRMQYCIKNSWQSKLEDMEKKIQECLARKVGNE